MKVVYFVPVVVLIAASYCIAQSAPPASNPSQAAQNASQGTQPAQSGQTDSSTSDPNAAQKPDQNKDKGNTAGKNANGAVTEGTSKDRLFFALPNFLTVDKNGKIIPLTTRQKFKVVAQGSFDPIQIVWYGALSGISQAENSEPGFGQGWEAYGKRFGAYAADGIIENFMVGAVFPSMLHQDPRFFPLAHGGFTHRAFYAASRILVTRGDSGRTQFNASEVFGSALASAISTYSYHPHPAYRPGPGFIASDRTLPNTASVWGSQMGYDAITYVVKEFWPDIRRKISKPKQSQ